MRVLLITGSYPPDVCGTADYTARLCESLKSAGLDASVFYRRNWGLNRVVTLLAEIERLKPDIIHMQYPTTGYGWKLGPQLIGTAKSLIVTLHEASQAHVLRQLSLYPFLLRSRHFIFTNRFEQQHVQGMAPWIASRTTVIPIGCNLPIVQERDKVKNTVTCFSIIRPDKGLEDVLAMTRELAASNSSARVRIVGAVMPRWTDYYSRLREQSASLPVDWMIGLDDLAVSEVLAEASLSYLPFPDGASERRSSLIAMLMNRACVMTTLGDQTPDEMASCVFAVQSPSEAAEKALQLLADPGLISRIRDSGAEYGRRFDWQTIAQQHAEVYSRSLQ